MHVVRAGSDRSPAAVAGSRAEVTVSEIARRAYDLYLARGSEHGRDVEDWLQAERALLETRRS